MHTTSSQERCFLVHNVIIFGYSSEHQVPTEALSSRSPPVPCGVPGTPSAFLAANPSHCLTTPSPVLLCHLLTGDSNDAMCESSVWHLRAPRWKQEAEITVLKHANGCRSSQHRVHAADVRARAAAACRARAGRGRRFVASISWPFLCTAVVFSRRDNLPRYPERAAFWG